MTSQVADKQISLPSWDLSDLYKSYNDPQINHDVQESLGKAKEFRKKYQGNLKTLSPSQLKDALKELENLHEIGDKPLCYAYLLHAADSAKAEHGALISRLQEAHTEISEETTFFTLEWNMLEDKDADKFLKDQSLSFYHHYLASIRKFKAYQLSEKEEIILQKVALTGGTAWTRLFDEVISRLRFKITCTEDGKQVEKEMSEEEVLSLLYSPERAIRKQASESLTEGLKSQKHLLTYLFNVLVQEHAIEDKFRGYPHPMKARNLSNEIDDEAVQALMKATESNVGLVARFYKLKKKLLGLDEMLDYDRYAPLSLANSNNKEWNWEEAKDFVLQSYSSFSPKFADIVKEFFDKNWIDAALRDGKRGGAFSASTVPSVHPYILVNFTGTSRDLSTLAHELGHGIHQYLSRKVGYLEADTPLTTAETASVFGEMLTFDRLVEKSQSKQEKLSLLVTKIDEIIATVYRQVYMTRFEEKLHYARREKGELTTEAINELWHESNKGMFGDSVTMTDNYSYWWLYISHFIHSPFYCYAYAFGLLLSITLYNESKKRGQEFKDKYTQILSLGGSMNPVDLIKLADVNINDPSFWMDGFKLIEGMIEQAEELAKEI
ncbi:MAG: M3 family oligoendopeptidase [Candidatus Caenarcaniphilales bacterium]|nr:M3 family oligoendopeptidase [Candidatus Caenarcaniphilales bacterium]